MHGPSLQRLLAFSYGLTYDAVVNGFPPYESLVREVVSFVTRGTPAAAPRASVRVLDVACGTGTVAAHLASQGYRVVALEAVPHLVSVARRRYGRQHANLTFEPIDISRDPLPGAGTFDVLVSMHTLYWHPNPHGFLAGCRRALKAGGHAIFLTYTRPASVARTFQEIWADGGFGSAVRALRWLVPTAIFELARRIDHRYLSPEEFHQALRREGFEVLESRSTFLAGISRLAWARAGVDGEAAGSQRGG